MLGFHRNMKHKKNTNDEGFLFFFSHSCIKNIKNDGETNNCNRMNRTNKKLPLFTCCFERKHNEQSRTKIKKKGTKSASAEFF